MKTKKKKYDLFDICNTIFMLLVVVVTLYPLYFTVIASFSNPDAVAQGRVLLWPVEFTLTAYQHILEFDDLWRGYANTILYTVSGTLFALFLTIPCAYAMSKQQLPHRSFLSTFFLIPMFFGGGLVPTYLLIKNLNLLNTRTILIIGGAFSVYNMIVTRTFFTTTIPDSLYEAAEMDGASEFKKFTAIALPLSKSIIAVMALFFAVGKWNSYFDAMIYVSNEAYMPLQLVLRNVLIMNQSAMSEALMEMQMTGSTEAIMGAIEKQKLAYTLKYAVVFIGSLPLLIAYPFVQKHFVKGMMIGSVKG